MHDYDVIIRVPIRARDLEEAHKEADGLEYDIRAAQGWRAEVEDVEPTGPSEEQ